MKWITRTLDQRRMIISLVLLLSLTGLVAWFNMIRQEDPAFPYRYGYAMVQFPGADVEQVEHLVARPLEEEISEVEEVDEIKTTIRAGFVHAIIGMKQTVYDTDNAWDKIRVAVARAEARFPQGAGQAYVDDRQVEAQTVVLAVGGSDDIIELQRAAERLKNRLYSISAVSRVRLFGDSGEQVTIAIDDASIQTLGITPQQIMDQLSARNQIVPGGFVEVDGRQTLVRPPNRIPQHCGRLPIRRLCWPVGILFPCLRLPASAWRSRNHRWRLSGRIRSKWSQSGSRWRVIRSIPLSSGITCVNSWMSYGPNLHL